MNNEAWRTEAMRLTQRRNERLTARERAERLGWRVDPNVTTPPHGWRECECAAGVRSGTLCPCLCHARSLFVWKRW